MLDAVNLVINQEWFYKISADFPMKINDLSVVIELLSGNFCFSADTANSDFNQSDFKKLRYCCDSLESFVNKAKFFLLPVIREKLGISYLSGHTPDKKSREFICYSFAAYAFPLNLQKIEFCLAALNRELGLAANRKAVAPAILILDNC